jgi:hypothetical protein
MPMARGFAIRAGMSDLSWGHRLRLPVACPEAIAQQAPRRQISQTADQEDIVLDPSSTRQGSRPRREGHAEQPDIRPSASEDRGSDRQSGGVGHIVPMPKEVGGIQERPQ